MILLSPQARRLIDDAVNHLPSVHDQTVWQVWARSHSQTRKENDPIDDGHGPIPRKIAEIALAALDTLASGISRQLASDVPDEDEILHLDNRLAYIRAIEAALVRDLNTTGDKVA